MIFVLHYILFNAGLPAVIILITLFLQTYSNASLSEIGTLLMALPFVSILIKPLFCALADRHRAHRYYLMGALAFMALGYGSLSVAPFFPELIAKHPHLVWYSDILAIIIGYSAFGIIWSLGDALAVNGAQMAGVSWGSYRVWGVVSWGIVGIIIGQINEIPILPKYVPAFFVLVSCLLAEIVLLAFWPNKYFVMCGTLEKKGASVAPEVADSSATQQATTKEPPYHRDSLADLEAHWAATSGGAGGGNRSLKGTLTGASLAGAGTLHRGNPRMIGAVANIFMEDLGGTLKSSLRLGSKPKRTGLDEVLLEQHQATLATKAAGGTEASEQQQATTGGGVGGSFGKGTLRKMMLAMNESMLARAAPGSAANSNTGTPFSTMGKAAALRALSGGGGGGGGSIRHHQSVHLSETATQKTASEQQQLPPLDEKGVADTVCAKEAGLTATAGTADVATPQMRSAEDLQLVLLKLIVRRDKTIGKYLVLFTLFGFLLTCHLSYFYLHLEHLCREKGNDFSSVTGGMLATHSISEILSFLVVPYYIPRVGRIGGLMTCALAYFVRFAYYGTYFVETSPYTGVPFEFCHGIAYGIVYSLITDIACECVNQVDEFLPELIERGLVAPDVHPNELKSPLRATMQGVFSGAFDGLGNGIGALFGGVYLDSHPFTSLWKFCAVVCIAIMVIYPITEWRALLNRPKLEKRDEKVGVSKAKVARVTANGNHIV